MHTISLRAGTRSAQTFHLPSGWDDLTPRQWQQVERAMGGWSVKKRFALLLLWSGLTLTHLAALDAAQRLSLLDLLDWLETPPTRWMRPRLWLGAARYQGPGDGLEHLSFGGFLFAEEGLKAATSAPALLDQSDIAAALYSPLDWRGAVPPFAHHDLADRARLMRRSVGAAGLAGIHYNYVGARAELIRTFPGVFGGTGSGDNAGADPGTTWLDVALSLARQTGALGSYAQLEQTNVYLVLTMLQALINEAARLKTNQS